MVGLRYSEPELTHRRAILCIHQRNTEELYKQSSPSRAEQLQVE